MITFGNRLKFLRKNKKLTQKDLAEQFSLDRSTISKYEKDIILPESKLLKSFAEFFNVSTDYLLGIIDIKRDVDFTNLSNHEKCALIFAQKLYDSGLEITENDIDDMILASKIILQYKKHQDE